MIYINDIPSLRNPDEHGKDLDHRIEFHELINGVIAEDSGHIPEGDVIKLTCAFSEANYNRLEELWERGQRVSYTDQAGKTIYNLLLILTNVQYIDNFYSYVLVKLELRRCQSYGIY